MPRPAAPAHVVAGELIESAWGNNVIDREDWDAGVYVSGSTSYWGILAQGATAFQTTDVNGVIAITYSAPYPATPYVDANTFQSAGNWYLNVFDVQLTFAQAVLRRDDGTIAANQGFAFQWFAIGPRHI